MWVRSQNKKFLGVYDSFSVSESGNVLGYQGPEDCEGVILGSYKSEDKAMLVLNDIQGHVAHRGIRNLITNFVFEMPLEEVSE